MVGTLLGAGADPNAALLSGESPVMTAARTGVPAVLGLLLGGAGDPNARGTRGQTALMWAASQRHPEAVRVLLEHGADVHARSETWTQRMAIPPHSSPANQQDVPHGGNTALMFAARVGDLASARLLVGGGADVNDADAWGVSATVMAAHSGFGDLVEFLLDEGADASAAEAGFSALHMAIMRRDAVMVRTLLAHGADANARLENWTPTRRASRDWHLHPSLVGASPFWLAARFAQPEVMRVLVEHGADPLFVHESHYVASAGSYGADGVTEATTALMAAVGMGGPRRLGAYVNPDRGQLEALTLEAVKLAVDLGAAHRYPHQVPRLRPSRRPRRRQPGRGARRRIHRGSIRAGGRGTCRRQRHVFSARSSGGGRDPAALEHPHRRPRAFPARRIRGPQ